MGNKLVLDDEKQKDLDDLKVKTRHSDAMYLRQHPELSLLINRFMWAVFEDSPDDPLTFAQDFFTQKNLETHILGIDGGDSSSDGEEDTLADLLKQRAQKRRTVKQMLQTKRKQRIRREKRAQAEKCVGLAAAALCCCFEQNQLPSAAIFAAPDCCSVGLTIAEH